MNLVLDSHLFIRSLKLQSISEQRKRGLGPRFAGKDKVYSSLAMGVDDVSQNL
jgi:hypothetical protein